MATGGDPHILPINNASMADTVITNTPAQSSDSGAGAVGMVVALIMLAALIIGGVYVYRNGGIGGADETNINVTLPVPGTGETGGTTP